VVATCSVTIAVAPAVGGSPRRDVVREEDEDDDDDDDDDDFPEAKLNVG